MPKSGQKILANFRELNPFRIASLSKNFYDLAKCQPPLQNFLEKRSIISYYGHICSISLPLRATLKVITIRLDIILNTPETFGSKNLGKC